MTDRIVSVFASIARGMRAVLGAPDYDRYVAHMRESHPGCAIISREQFAKERLEARYSRPGARCC